MPLCGCFSPHSIVDQRVLTLLLSSPTPPTPQKHRWRSATRRPSLWRGPCCGCSTTATLPRPPSRCPRYVRMAVVGAVPTHGEGEGSEPSAILHLIFFFKLFLLLSSSIDRRGAEGDGGGDGQAQTPHPRAQGPEGRGGDARHAGQVRSWRSGRHILHTSALSSYHTHTHPLQSTDGPPTLHTATCSWRRSSS